MAKIKTTTEEPLEKQLWKAADKLRKNIDAAEYKHVVLGLIFLKYISDSFEEQFAKLKAGEGEYQGADPEEQGYTEESNEQEHIQEGVTGESEDEYQEE